MRKSLQTKSTQNLALKSAMMLSFLTQGQASGLTHSTTRLVQAASKVAYVCPVALQHAVTQRLPVTSLAAVAQMARSPWAAENHHRAGVAAPSFETKGLEDLSGTNATYVRNPQTQELEIFVSTNSNIAVTPFGHRHPQLQRLFQSVKSQIANDFVHSSLTSDAEAYFYKLVNDTLDFPASIWIDRDGSTAVATVIDSIMKSRYLIGKIQEESLQKPFHNKVATNVAGNPSYHGSKTGTAELSNDDRFASLVQWQGGSIAAPVIEPIEEDDLTGDIALKKTFENVDNYTEGTIHVALITPTPGTNGVKTFPIGYLKKLLEGFHARGIDTILDYVYATAARQDKDHQATDPSIIWYHQAESEDVHPDHITAIVSAKKAFSGLSTSAFVAYNKNLPVNNQFNDVTYPRGDTYRNAQEAYAAGIATFTMLSLPDANGLPHHYLRQGFINGNRMHQIVSECVTIEGIRAWDPAGIIGNIYFKKPLEPEEMKIVKSVFIKHKMLINLAPTHLTLTTDFIEDDPNSDRIWRNHSLLWQKFLVALKEAMQAVHASA